MDGTGISKALRQVYLPDDIESLAKLLRDSIIAYRHNDEHLSATELRGIREHLKVHQQKLRDLLSEYQGDEALLAFDPVVLEEIV